MLFSANDTHTHCLVRSVYFSVPSLSACLARTFVSRAGGTEILKGWLSGNGGGCGMLSILGRVGSEAGSVSSKA